MMNLKTKQEFEKVMFETFTIEELSMINIVIYFNPEHIEYYQKYHAGEYDWCLDYLLENRELLQQY